MTQITTSALASYYLRGADATAELERRVIARVWRGLVAQQYVALVEQLGVRVEFVSGWPFQGGEGDSASKLFASIDSGYLPITTDFNESELNGSEGNLLFRAAHDLSHYLCDLEHRDEGRRCNFKLDGETRAAHRQATHLLELLGGDPVLSRETRTRIVQIVFSEVILQAAVFYETGDFAEQKVVLVPLAGINAWFTQNGLPALNV